jgi:hypothetical protein
VVVPRARVGFRILNAQTDGLEHRIDKARDSSDLACSDSRLGSALSDLRGWTSESTSCVIT